jgi:DNA-binding CsgD family transcriptional regulator
MLRQSGQHARCVAPSAKLADLLVMQGRLEEAEDILAGDDDDSTLLVRARLALERRNIRAAVALLDRACRRLGGDSLLTVPALVLLVDAHLAGDDIPSAIGVVDRLALLAGRTSNRRVAGRAALASARVKAATGEVSMAIASLETALDHFAVAAPGGTERAEVHLELARLHASIDPIVAASEARAALAGFEAAGATHRADNAAALLRALGDRSRTLARSRKVLTHREQEVLRLVALGLTNAEIADRLYISGKTAGNHVSHILSKLNLRSRVEAAAYALVHAED